MAFVAILRHDRYHPALAPGLEDESFDFILAGSIALLLAVFGAQIETFEVAEAVIAVVCASAGNLGQALAWSGRGRTGPGVGSPRE